MKSREQQIGFILVGIGALWFLTTVIGGDSGWLWIGAVAAAFLVAHGRTQNPGLAVPGGVLAGVAAGILLESLLPFEGSAFLLGLAGGFYTIRALEPRVHFWAVYPASILSAIAALIFMTQNAVLIAIVLIGAGLYLLTRNRAPRTSAAQPSEMQPEARKRQALEKWRASLATLEGKPEGEILRGEQITALAALQADSLDDLAGVIDGVQMQRYGNQILEILRSAQ